MTVAVKLGFKSWQWLRFDCYYFRGQGEWKGDPFAENSVAGMILGPLYASVEWRF